jgi:P21-Rho-binding domain
MMSQFFNNVFNKFSGQQTADIGKPTSVKHGISVKNENGLLVGLPKSWKRMLDEQITKEEQKSNPEAADRAIKFLITYQGVSVVDDESIEEKNTGETIEKVEEVEISESELIRPPTAKVEEVVEKKLALLQANPTKTRVTLKL